MVLHQKLPVSVGVVDDETGHVLLLVILTSVGAHCRGHHLMQCIIIIIIIRTLTLDMLVTLPKNDAEEDCLSFSGDAGFEGVFVFDLGSWICPEADLGSRA